MTGKSRAPKRYHHPRFGLFRIVFVAVLVPICGVPMTGYKDKLRIWPPTQVSIAWPGKTMSDMDAAYTSNAFMNFVLGIQSRDFRARGRASPRIIT